MKGPQLIILFLAAVAAANATKKIVCYYSSWAVYYKNKGAVAPTDIDPSLCTHIIYAYLSINNADGSLKIQDNETDIEQGGFVKTAELKRRNPNVKVLFSVGGASATSQTFSNIAGSPPKRTNFVRCARNLVQQYNFDGLDIHWEIPRQGDRSNFIALLGELRNDFSKNGWLLSAGVSAAASAGYDVYKMSSLLDMINIMIYDLYGPWSQYTGHNAALYPSPTEGEYERNNLNMDASVKQWLKAGAPAEKLVAGLAFYGHTFTLADRSKKGVHAPIRGAGKGGSIVGEAGTISYVEYCTTQNSWQCSWDDIQKVPICISGDQWLGLDNEQSIREKMNYIHSRNLGGAMIWSIDQDDVHGLCGKKYPLLTTITSTLDTTE